MMKQVVCALTLVVVFAACSSSGSKNTTPPTTAAPAVCTNPNASAPKVTKVPDVAHDYTLTSFDGSRIRFHWFPIAKEAPVVLMGPGWGESGAEENSGTGLFGDSPVKSLETAGYHVLTWDPRGFGKST